MVLATNLVMFLGIKQFPLLSKSARLQKLIATTTTDEQSDDEIRIPDIPGGPPAFEICAKFCYGMTVTLNAYNVVAVRCAAEYLEMYESIESGNLVYKIEVFLNSSVLRSWKDSIIVLQTTRSFYPWSEDVKIDVRCLESIALKAAIDPARVDWSYTYNRRKLIPPEIKNNGVPRDWWIEDLAELSIDLFKRVISTIRRKGGVLPEVIGEALEVYAAKRIPCFMIQNDDNDDEDVMEERSLLETLVSMLPSEKQSVSCGFLIKLLKCSVSLECGEEERKELSRRIGEKLEEANVTDLLIRAPEGGETVYDIDIVETLIDEFVTQTQRRDELDCSDEGNGFVSDSSKANVAKLIDGYLAEISRIEPNLSPLKFITVAEKVSNFPRSSHDGVYRAIDMFLKVMSALKCIRFMSFETKVLIFDFTATSRNNKEREEISMSINGLPEIIAGGLCSRRAKREVTITSRCADPLLRASSCDLSHHETFSSTEWLSRELEDNDGRRV